MNILSTREIQEVEARKNLFLHSIQPIIEAKTRIYDACKKMTFVLKEDGSLSDVQYNFTPEQEESLRLADETIEHIRSRMGIAFERRRG